MNKRLLILALGVFSLFSVLIFQFYKIQMIEGEKWVKIAKRQHFFSITEPFLRGRFIANTSIKKKHPEEPQYYVFDILKYHLYIDPASIPERYRDEIAEELLQRVKVKNKEKFRANFDRKSRSRKLAMWLNSESKDAITEWWRPYARKQKIARNAVYFVNDYQRSHPFGKLLGQVLHTVQGHKDEVTKQAHPTGGLELYFNEYLRGKLGKRLLKRSPRHSFEMGTVIESPKNGADIYLTINHVLQEIAEEELERGVKKCGAKGGWAVMLDPKSGEVLAMAQYPFFYPEKYPRYFNDPEQMENTKVRAVTDAYEPGSVMKPVTLAIALKANQELRQRGESPLFDPESRVDTKNRKFPGRGELRDIGSYSFLNMDMALQKSSNIYMARLTQKIVNRLGDQWYRDQLSETFGFSRKTKIELPSESAGVLPTPGKLHPNGHPEWSTPTPFSLAMGHNIQVNSLQMVRAIGIIANRGRDVEPTLIKKVVKQNSQGEDELLFEAAPPSGHQLIDPEIAERVIRSMKFVTKPGGSGKRAEIWGYTEAGKTGTANKIVDGKYSKQKYVSSFVGFTPVKDPAFVLMVVMDEPEVRYIPGVGQNNYGSVAAAPVFREIARRSLEYLGLDPDDPHGYPRSDPRFDAQQADWISEVQQLQEIFKKWNM